MRLGYIDALRGIAALGVIATHCLIMVQGLPWHFSAVVAQGRHGVQLFFVLSALTLLRSWRRRSPDLAFPIQDFYIRRLCRIAPLFWIAAYFYGALGGLWHPFWADVPITPTAFGLTLIFAHGWLPSTINAVVPGGWSIATEMAFYVLFPGLALAVSSLRWAILFAAAAYLLCFAATPLADHLFPLTGSAANRFFAYTWLPNQLVAFSFGFLAYHLVPILPRWRSLGRVLIGLALACILATATWPLPFTASWEHPFSRDLIASASALGLVLGMAIWPSKALVNRFICHVGRISFSVYIWHWVPLEVARLVIGPRTLAGLAGISWYCVIFATATILTLLIAGASFRAIEQPMIEFGNRLAERGRGRARA